MGERALSGILSILKFGLTLLTKTVKNSKIKQKQYKRVKSSKKNSKQ